MLRNDSDFRRFRNPFKADKIRARFFCFVRRTFVRRSKYEMKRNADIGLFTEPSLNPVIRCLLGDNHIVDMALAHAGRTDFLKTCLFS